MPLSELLQNVNNSITHYLNTTYIPCRMSCFKRNRYCVHENNKNTIRKVRISNPVALFYILL